MRIFRWAFLVGPLRMYKRGEETQGAVPWMYLLAIFPVMAFGALVGVVVGVLRNLDTEASAGTGLAVASGALVGWFVYGLLLVGALRLLGRPIEDFVGPGWKRRRRRWWER